MSIAVISRTGCTRCMSAGDKIVTDAQPQIQSACTVICIYKWNDNVDSKQKVVEVSLKMIERHFYLKIFIKEKVKMRKLRTLLCVLSFSCMLNPVAAEELSKFEAELLQTQILTAKSSLNLTSEQEQKFNELLQSGAKQRQQTLKKYDITMGDEKRARLNFREKRALMEDMQKLKGNLEEQLEYILTADQLRLFQEIQEKNQQVFRERLRSKIN
jgi:hypothetical protein